MGTDAGETLHGGAGDDVVDGGGGGDLIYGHQGDDYLIGGAGDDQLNGQEGDDVLVGGDGRDDLRDEDDGDDQQYGGDGDDWLGVTRNIGSPPGETVAILDGGAGNDYIRVTEEWRDLTINASIFGGAGDDAITLLFRLGSAVVDAGDGNDTITLLSIAGADLTLGEGQDSITFLNLGTGAIREAVVIRDFQTGDAGDRLDIRDWLAEMLSGWDGDNFFDSGHLRLLQSGADTLLQIDHNGGGDSWESLVDFRNTASGDLTAFNLGGWAPGSPPPPGQVIVGTSANDSLTGTIGADLIQGLEGDDTLSGLAGDDRLEGGLGADSLDGGAGVDVMFGGEGDDWIRGDQGDTLYGEAGDDYLSVSLYAGIEGQAEIRGGDGADQIYIGFLEDAIGQVSAHAGDGDDRIMINGSGLAMVDAGAGADTFTLNEADGAILTLGAGADVVKFDPLYESRNITITDFETGDGGDRLDILDFLIARFDGWDGSTNPFAAGFLRLVTIDGDVALELNRTGAGTWERLVLFEDVAASSLTAWNLGGYGGDGAPPPGQTYTGTAGRDTIQGGVGGDVINGLDGADVLRGDRGDDVLNGGDGDDRLAGSYGSDLLLGGAGADRLTDHAGISDRLYGEDGDDTINASYGLAIGVIDILLDGGAGDDQIDYSGPQSGRATIAGGAGADHITVWGGSAETVVDAGEGADVVRVKSFEGDDVDITLGAGADRLVLMYGTRNEILVRDFEAEDTLDLVELLNFGSDYSGGAYGDGYLRIVLDGDDTVIQRRFSWDVNDDWVSVVRLQGVTPDQLTAANIRDFGVGPSWLVGDAGADNLTAGPARNLDGADGDDTLTGDAAVNELIGGDGDDIITGGGSNDTLSGGAGIDTAVFAGPRSAYTVTTSGGTTTVSGPDGVDTLATIERLRFDDMTLIVGAGGGQYFEGTAGANTINSTAFNDQIYGLGGNDVINALAGNDVVYGGDGDDTINAGGGVDILYGGEGADRLEGDSGDQLHGENGDDVLVVQGSAAAAAVLVSGGAGTDTLILRGTSASLNLAAGTGLADATVLSVFATENVTVEGTGASVRTISGSSGANRLTTAAGSTFGVVFDGRGGDDVLTGGLGDDVLRGGAGVDVLIGGGGIDLADYSQAAGGVTASLTLGGASNDGDGATDSFSGIENLQGSAFNDTLTGNGANNRLVGGAGNDILDGLNGDDVLIGGAGVDVLIGGGGIDTVDYSGAASGMRAQLNTNASTNDGDGGTDTFSGIENLTGSAFNDVLIGDGNANVLRGGLGSDTLIGLAGNDVLWGGAGAVNTLQGGIGNDLYVLEAWDTIVEFAGEGTDTVDARINTYVLANHVENLIFGGVGNFNGTGNSANNIITGGAGDDVLRGGAGNDVLNGGAGADTADYTLAAAGAVIRLDLQRATNNGDGGTDTYTSIEHAIGSNFNDVIFGDGGNNVLRGGNGSDVLVGGGGDDVLMGGSGGMNNQLQGGTGNDWYILEAFDTCVEFAGEGIDTVEARVGSYTLGANIENLIYTGPGKFVGTGNALNNIITGGALNDILRGGGGDDIINGGLGTDEVQLRGTKAQYTVTAEGNGWRIVDGVAGRDGSTYVESIEVLRFVTGNTTTVLTYPPPAPATTEATDKSTEALVLPLAEDPSAPLVIPGAETLDLVKGWQDMQVLPDAADDFLPLPGETPLKGWDDRQVLPGAGEPSSPGTVAGVEAKGYDRQILPGSGDEFLLPPGLLDGLPARDWGMVQNLRDSGDGSFRSLEPMSGASDLRPDHTDGIDLWQDWFGPFRDQLDPWA